MNRRGARQRACALISLGLVLGCAGSRGIVPPPDAATGTVSGTVTLLGTDESGVSTGHLSLYSSLGDFEVRRVAYDGPLTPTQPGGRTFSFVLAVIRPGTYYVTACFAFGCGEYRDPQRGELVPVTVPAQGTTQLDLSF
jgi:hypothetical protein